MGSTSVAWEGGGKIDLQGPEASQDAEEGGLAAAIGTHDHD